jgi:hypothetical protein
MPKYQPPAEEEEDKVVITEEMNTSENAHDSTSKQSETAVPQARGSEKTT